MLRVIITDIDLVKAFFAQVQDILGGSICLERLRDAEVQIALRDFFRLKECWKFLSKKSRLGKYYFSHAEYQIARIEYEKNWGMRPSRFDSIFVSLSSEFNTHDDILEAESIIGENIKRFIEVYK